MKNQKTQNKLTGVYFWGGCRPVLMESFAKEAGFRNVIREIPKNLLPSEIVTGLK
ncbi:MAG: hypothetical protein PHP73_01675 [Candidatus Omnitrophica bacterium]|nr:hypothetical protein [Candidatus Omnitrophota bacterium]